MPEGVPQYQRGPEPNWFLPAANRDDGITYLGSASRLRLALDRLRNGACVCGLPACCLGGKPKPERNPGRVDVSSGTADQRSPHPASSQQLCNLHQGAIPPTELRPNERSRSGRCILLPGGTWEAAGSPS